jgi:WD40 repeat protein
VVPTLASGSLDTNLKIWDIRRKGCIHTYKGHDRGVAGLYKANAVDPCLKAPGFNP